MTDSEGHTRLTLDVGVGCSEETDSAKGGGHCVVEDEVWQELADGPDRGLDSKGKWEYRVVV